MFCPMLKGNCVEHECAWWIAGNSNCAITELAEVGITTFVGDEE